MREFSIDMTQEVLANGLRGSKYSKLNRFSLESAKNFRVLNGSLEPVEFSETNPLDFDLTATGLVNLDSTILYTEYNIVIDIPYPQMFANSRVMLIATRDKILKVASESLEVVAEGIRKSVNYPWSFIEFDDVWFMANGSTLVITDDEITTVKNTGVNFISMTKYQERIIIAGFHSDINSDIDAFTNFTSNTLWFSNVGAGDFQRVVNNSLTNDDLDMMTSGFLTMKWSGTIFNVVPIGEGIVVYGTGGISYCYSIAEPIPTMGQRTLTEIGIISKTAVDGNDKVHCFVDLKGVIWLLNADMSLVRLGYSEFVNALILSSESEIAVNYNPRYNEFYISSDGGTLLVNPVEGKVTQLTYLISSLLYKEGSTIVITQ